MYHQIDVEQSKGTPMRGLVVSPSKFSRQMALMDWLGYRGLSMHDLEPYLLGEKSGKVFGITFDDGYQNNIRFALPILKRYGFTSTCYIVADKIGQSNSWDAETGVKQVPLMTQCELQTWIDAGQEVGSHTLSHLNLKEIDVMQQAIQIKDSKTKLEQLVHQLHGVRHFCYPYGGVNHSAVQCVIDAGYSTATTTVRGRVFEPKAEDMLLLPRVLVSRTTTWIQLLMKCFTNYEDRRGRGRMGSQSL